MITKLNSLEVQAIQAKAMEFRLFIGEKKVGYFARMNNPKGEENWAYMKNGEWMHSGTNDVKDASKYFLAMEGYTQ